MTRPGGRIGLVAHTPEGFIGQLFKTIGRHVPAAGRPALADPVGHGWSGCEELFGDSIAELRTEKRHYTFRDRSPEAFVDYWRRYYGPTLKAFDAVGVDGSAGARGRHRRPDRAVQPRDDGTMVVPSEYLEAVIVTR